MKIVNFGSMNLDYVYKVAHFVQPGETLAAERMNIFPGGKGLNQSIAASKAGGEVYHAGFIGKNGEMLVRCLKDASVLTEQIEMTEMNQGHALIQVNEQGENCIIIYGGSNRCITDSYINHTLEQFDSDTYVMLQNEVNRIGDIVEAAYRKGMKIILNPSPINDSVFRVDFHKVDWLLVNALEAKAIAKTEKAIDAIDEIWKKYPQIGIVLTLGAKGCICCKDSVRKECRAFPVEVADTTAAGDTFAGYFVAGLAKGRQMDEILQSASAAAAIAVSREGASPSIPAWEEVERFLQKYKGEER